LACYSLASTPTTTACGIGHPLGLGTEQLGDQPGQKAKYWLIFKQITRAAPRFFVCAVCVGMSLVNSISVRKFSRRQIGGPAVLLYCLLSHCGRESGSGSGWAVAWLLASDSRPLLSAGGCLVVTTGTTCGAKPNSLTPLGPVVLPLLKFTM
jgi:hypothetical protein